MMTAAVDIPETMNDSQVIKCAMAMRMDVQYARRLSMISVRGIAKVYPNFAQK